MRGESLTFLGAHECPVADPVIEAKIPVIPLLGYNMRLSKREPLSELYA